MHNDDGSNILKAWTATFVRRWHTQPLLSDTNDFTSGHQQRTTVLLLLFFPNSVWHDQATSSSGSATAEPPDSFWGSGQKRPEQKNGHKKTARVVHYFHTGRFKMSPQLGKL